jgi:hypothetical protein
MDLVGAELFRAPVRTDGRTDKYVEANRSVCNFAKAPKTEEHKVNYTFLLTLRNFCIYYF